MSTSLDHGSLLFANLAVLAVFVPLEPPLKYTWPWLSFTFYAPLASVGDGLCSGHLAARQVADLRGGFGNAFERDYSPLLIWTAMARAGWIFPPPVIAALTGIDIASCRESAL
jgi:hypothetical protein